jgi:hypothetical protein
MSAAGAAAAVAAATAAAARAAAAKAGRLSVEEKKSPSTAKASRARRAATQGPVLLALPRSACD